jgi:membrane protein YqaA with SNARE-associated domain
MMHLPTWLFLFTFAAGTTMAGCVGFWLGRKA